MKKFFYLASAALLLASCSNEAAEVVDNNVPTPTPEEELSYPTEQIQLGTNARVSAGTRATIVDAWNNHHIGVLALCTEATLATGENWGENITLADGTATDNQPALLKGVEATVAAPGTPGDPSEVTLVGGPYYYPRTSTRDYNFYGYYPYAAANYANGIYSVTGTFTGQDDILAGVSEPAVAEGTVTGWNAKYIRALRAATKTTTPDIKFEHMTAQFQILLQEGQSYNPAQPACQINRVSIDLAPSYTLQIVKQGGTGEDAKPKLTVDGTPLVTRNILVESSTDLVTTGVNQMGNKYNGGKLVAWPATEIAAAVSGGKVNPYNDAIFVPAAATADDEYTIAIEFNTTPATASLVSFKYSDLTDKVNLTDTKFTAGKAYRIVLTINGPEEIKLTASLTDWAFNGNINLEL